MEHAEALATYDHPFFGRWPAITRNLYGSGELVYEGTQLSDALQAKVVRDSLKSAGVAGVDQKLPASVREKHGTNRYGKLVHYYLNYSSNIVTFPYPYAAGESLIAGAPVKPYGQLTLQPWDVAIIEEGTPH